MTKVIEQPRRPLVDWQHKLDAWLEDVHEIIHQASHWAEQRGWSTQQDQKLVTEEVIGTYEAPRLLIHTPQGRLLLDPIARYVVGAEGRFEFCVMPSYDSVLLIKSDGNWKFFSTSRMDLNLPWSEQSFEQVALELLKTP